MQDLHDLRPRSNRGAVIREIFPERTEDCLVARADVAAESRLREPVDRVVNPADHGQQRSLVEGIEVVIVAGEPGKCPQRTMQRIDAKHRPRTVGLLEEQLITPEQHLLGRLADLAQELAKLRVGAEEQVQALLDPVAVLVAVGRGATTEVWQALEDVDLHAGIDERLGAGEPCEPTSGNGDTGRIGRVGAHGVPRQVHAPDAGARPTRWMRREPFWPRNPCVLDL
jgi:hypothetical protein